MSVKLSSYILHAKNIARIIYSRGEMTGASYMTVKMAATHTHKITRWSKTDMVPPFTFLG